MGSETYSVTQNQESAEGGDELRFIYAQAKDGRTVVVARSQVLWAKAHGDYLWLHTKTGESYSKRETLKNLEHHWTKHGFARIHKSYLAFLPCTRDLRLGGWGWLVTVSFGADTAALPVGRKRVPHLKRLLQERAPESTQERRNPNDRKL